MRLMYLGTAACEGVPDPFCNCRVCRDARARGGRNIRTRPQALLDGKILLDFGPDTYLHALRYSLNLSEIAAVLITHPHFDHFIPDEISYLPYYAHGCGTLQIYAAADTVELAASRDISYERIAFHTVGKFVPFEVSGYRVTPLAADHGPRDSLVYAVEREGKSLLYLHDTGMLPEKSWEYLSRMDTRFDLVSYDCCGGLLKWDNKGHMALEGCAETKRRLEEMGRVSDSTAHVVNHFSHNCEASYDEMVPRAARYGFTVSYDGLTVDF